MANNLNIQQKCMLDLGYMREKVWAMPIQAVQPKVLVLNAADKTAEINTWSVIAAQTASVDGVVDVIVAGNCVARAIKGASPEKRTAEEQ